MEYRLKLKRIEGGFLVSGLDAVGGAYSEGQVDDRTLVDIDIRDAVERLKAAWHQNRGPLRSMSGSPEMVITDSYD